MVLKRLLTYLALWAALFFSPQLHATWVLPPVNVTNTSGEADVDPQLAIDPQGNAVAVWQSTDLTLSVPFSIFAAYYTYSTNTWSTRVQISTNTLGENAVLAKIGVDANGNAQAVWLQENSDGNHDVFTSTFTFATHTWSTATPIFSAGTNLEASDCQVAVAPNGNACAVWRVQSFSGLRQIYGSTYSGTWLAPVVISPNLSPLNAKSPQVGVNATGVPLAIWSEDLTFPGGSFINSAQGTTSNTWTINGPVSTTNSGDTNEDPSLAVDPSGNAKAIWNFGDGTNSSVNGNSYISGAWQPTVATLITDTTFVPGKSQVGVDAAGNAVAIWQWENSPTSEVLTSTSPAGANVWTAPVTLATFSTNNANLNNVAVGVDASGNASAVWNQGSGGNEYGPCASIVYGSNYDFTSGMWAPTPTQLSDPTQFPCAITPTVAGVTAQGNPIAMWSATNLVDRANIQATTFSEVLLPPTNFVGTCGKNHFASQTVYSTTLTWTPSPTVGVLGYKIYEGTTLIATVPASGPFVFVIKNINRNETFTYTIVAYNIRQQSVPVTIVVPPGKNCKNKC